jgi:hypothetical protein
MAAKKTAKKPAKKTAKKPAKKAAKKSTSNGHHGVVAAAILGISPALLVKIVAEVRAYLRTIRKALPGLVRYREGQRRSSIGRLRKGEDGAISAVLDTVEARPELFVALAAKDNGVDDKVVETQPSRDDLERHRILKPLLEDLQQLRLDVGDSVLELAARPRRFSIAAYAIADTMIEHDDELDRTMAPAKRFYASQNAKKSEQAPKAPKGAKAPATPGAE